MVTDPTDSMLRDSMRSGDVDAWGLIFDRHAQRAYRFGSRFVGDRAEAEDVLSDTFLEVWRSLKSFKVHGESALPILLAISRRVCQKRARTSGRAERTIRLTMQHPTSMPDIAEAVGAASDARERQAWLRQHVAAMPIEFRDAFELVIFAEMPYQMVANLLDVPLGTVKSRMSRGRQMLEESALTLDRPLSSATTKTGGSGG